MTAAEMEAIVNGTHGDAFAVLGPHLVDSDPVPAPSALASVAIEVGAALGSLKAETLRPTGFAPRRLRNEAKLPG